MPMHWCWMDQATTYQSIPAAGYHWFILNFAWQSVFAEKSTHWKGPPLTTTRLATTTISMADGYWFGCGSNNHQQPLCGFVTCRWRLSPGTRKMFCPGSGSTSGAEARFAPAQRWVDPLQRCNVATAACAPGILWADLVYKCWSAMILVDDRW